MNAIPFGLINTSEEQNKSLLTPTKVFPVPWVELTRGRDTHDDHDRFISFKSSYKENNRSKRYLTKEATNQYQKVSLKTTRVAKFGKKVALVRETPTLKMVQA